MVQAIQTQDSAAWAQSVIDLYAKLKPYRKTRSVITVRNDCSSTLVLRNAYVSKGEFDADPGIGKPLAPGEGRLFSVKTSAGMPGYEIYGVWQVAEPTEGDSYTAIVACRWSQPKCFKAVAPPDVLVGLSKLSSFDAFLKKKSFNPLKHGDIAAGVGKTHFGRIRQIIKETDYTNKDREGVVITGISAVNSEFIISDIGKGASQTRKKTKLKIGRARRRGKTVPF